MYSMHFPRRAFSLSYKHIRLSFGHGARRKLVQGMKTLASTTAKTYGPGGRNVDLEYEYGEPKITKDGVTVAKSIFMGDREEELGAKLLKRVAHGANTYCGDGTTLSTFFSTDLVEKACAAIENGVHPTPLKHGMEKARDATLNILKEFSMPVTNEEELRNVCLVSSNYNEEIADITAKAINSIDSLMGVSGNLEIEPSRTGQNMLEISKGLFLERGWVSELFTETEFGDPVSKEVTLDYPLILVCHCPIKKNETVVKLMDYAKVQKRTLLVFSTDLQADPMTSMVYNAKKGVMNSCAVNIPFMAGKELDYIEDIAVATGAQILKDDNLADSIDDIKPEHLGSAAKVIIGEDSTQIIKGAGTEEAMKQHMDTILARIETEESKHFKKIMRDRYTRLNQLQATIYVGGSSETEQGEQRDLIVDSLNSARAALEKGILPGGGAAMFHASKLLPIYTNVDMIEENLGVQIFQSACQGAMKRIIGNAVGDEKVGYLIEQIEQKGSYLYGYNCKSHKIEDLYEAGVVDSYKVISSVIEDSVRLATMIIMVECNVIKKKDYVPTELSEHQKYKEPF